MILVSLVLCLSSLPAHAQTAFIREDITSGLAYPTAFAFGPNGRIFIAEKEGYVRVFDAASGVLRAQPVIDLRDEVNSNTDRGLVGIALHPEFARNGWMYVLYVRDATGQTQDGDQARMARLARYTLNAREIAEPGSAVMLLEDYEATTAYHNVNTLRFAPDGALFVSLGDGSLNFERSDLAYRAQALDTLHGKLLRIDADSGAGLPGNPYFDALNPRSARSRVWSRGHRNPFRFGIHPQSGIPYVGNVGWNTYESLQRATAGANFGWPCVEGLLLREEYADDARCAGVAPWTVTPSLYDAGHAGNNASIVGGAFNPGGNFPAEGMGDYYFGDYSTQKIQRATLRADGSFARVSEFASGAGELVDLQFGPDGALYTLSIVSGVLRRYRNALVELARPHAAANALRITSPGPHDVARAGERITLRAEADARAGSRYWWASVRDQQDAAINLPLLDVAGPEAVLNMPNFGAQADTRFVELVHAAWIDGQLHWARARLYAQPDDGYIRSWLLTRSHPNKTIENSVLDEAAFRPRGGDAEVFGIRSPSRLINLKRWLSPNQDLLITSSAMAMAVVYIDSPDARDALLALNSDESIVAWLNGKQVWINFVEREVIADQRDLDLPKVRLNAGMNTLLIKTHQTQKSPDTWAFKARLLQPDGAPMLDLAFKTTP